MVVTLRGTIVALGLVIVCGAGCPAVHPPYDYKTEPDPRKQEYVLGPSDVLKISVWRNPDLSGEAIVRPDGTISVALAGGPNRFASPEKTIIIRTDTTKGVRRVPIDYPSIMAGTHPEQDLPL